MRRTMKFQKLCVILLFATMVAIGSESAACTNASLTGVYGYFHGRPGAVSTTVVGQLTLDGLGNVTHVSWTATNYGSIVTGTTTGKYSLPSNCNGTLTLNNEHAATAHFNLYVNASSTTIQMIETDTAS